MIKIHRIGCGVCANDDESMHFTQNNDEKIICLETGEIFDSENFIMEEEQ